MNPSDKHKRKVGLSRALLVKFSFFEKATEELVLVYKEELVKDEMALRGMSSNVPDIDDQNYKNISEEEWKVIDAYSDLYMSIEFRKEYLLSLLEMNVLYLFKSLELTMKEYINIAYPGARTKELYQWDSMKAFFKSNSIDIARVDGYGACVELRKVNNAIKHNGIITEDIKQIKEFRLHRVFNHINLEAFYNRIRGKIEKFCSLLRDKVEENIYEFPVERLEMMAQEFYERMDDVTMQVFVEKLKEKIVYPKSGGSQEWADELPF